MLEAIAADGAAAGADGVGMHLYVWAPPENRYEDVLRLRALIAAGLGGVPLFCTEWGFNSARYTIPPDGTSGVGRQRQAVMDLREVLMSWRAALPLVILYDIRDDGTDAADPEHNFGLLARDYSDKPAMKALRTLSTVAKDRKLVGIADPADARPGLHVLRLDGASDTVLVVWAEIEGATATVRLPAASVRSATTMYGEPLAYTDTFLLDEQTGPIYVTLAQRPQDGGTDAPDVTVRVDAAPQVDADAPTIDTADLSADQEGGCGCRTRPGRPWSAVFLLTALGAMALRRARA
jgi:hypothetical protein